VLQQQLLRLWQQQQCPSTHGCMHTHRARSRSSRVASALDKLDIKPISITAEERQLPEQPAADLNIQPLDAWCQDPFLISGCEPGAAPLRVAVLVSGGVDSSLALQLVTAAGHKATAFYLQIWFQEDFRNFWDACPWEEDLSYAQQVCDALGVPLVVVPLTQQYWDRVVAHSVADIKAGRTPNPDMWCNSRCGAAGQGRLGSVVVVAYMCAADECVCVCWCQAALPPLGDVSVAPDAAVHLAAYACLGRLSSCDGKDLDGVQGSCVTTTAAASHLTCA
jgi:hypothetical protein